MLNVDTLYEMESAHRNYFHLPLFLQEKEELRIKSYNTLTDGWQISYFPKALTSVELGSLHKTLESLFLGRTKKISQHLG